jgi:hypothetical protein
MLLPTTVSSSVLGLVTYEDGAVVTSSSSEATTLFFVHHVRGR